MINKKKLVIYIIVVVVIAYVAFSLTNGTTAKDLIQKGGSKMDTTKTEPASTAEAKNRIVTIETNKGTIKFEIYEKEAPITSKNFIELTGKGFYDGLTFHRVVPGFVIQGGDPKGDGTGGSGKTIQLEINPKLKHVEGAVAMARTMDPNSATSQFYITLAPQTSLDGQYAVFGKVTEGMAVVKNITKGDIMKKITISS
jgi:cyclophilin family peptidyl-prolyl cis-trans isomerase